MFKNTVLFVLLLSGLIFGQDTSFWKPYISDFQGKDITKMEFNHDSTRLYIWSVNSLYSFDLSTQKTSNLLTVQSINDFFVNDSSIYISTNLNYSTKIRVSNTKGVTWKDIPITDAFYGFYVKSHVIYTARYLQPSSYAPPTFGGIWQADSSGNNLTELFDHSSRVYWIGVANDYVYYYGCGGIFSSCNFFKYKGHTIYFKIPTNEFYFNNYNGDVYYRSSYSNSDTLFKARTWDIYRVPSIQSMFFFDTTNVLVATEKGFYLKTSEMNSFVKIINSNPAFVKYMIKDKENYIYLATTKGIFKSSLPLDKMILLDNNESQLVVNNFNLSNNYPNPFNPSTKINFTVDQPKHIKLKVFDLLGKEVKVLVDEFKSAGSYDVDFNAADLPSGVYIYSLTDGKNIISKKMTLIK